MPHGPDFPDPNRFVNYDPNAPNILRFLNPVAMVKGLGHAAMDHVLIPVFNATLERFGHEG